MSGPPAVEASVQPITRRNWIGFACIAATVAVMLHWSWLRWPDVLVDFGGEVYVPWRITEGDVLYRDQVYFTGPLSPYVNALWFRVFGVSLRTLFVANFVVTIAIAALLYRLLVAIGDRFVATVALIAFFLLFAFSQFGGIANYNYLAPYSHETTHGALIALGALATLHSWTKDHRRWKACACGGLVGLAFLTKVEVFLAVTAAITIGMGIELWRARREGVRWVGSAFLFALGVMLPVAIAFALLSTAMDPAAALRGTLGAWPYTLDTRISAQPFYRSVMGTDHTRWSVNQLLSWTGLWVLVVAAAVAAATRMQRDRKWDRGWACAAFALVAGGLVFTLRHVGWEEAMRPLPVVACVAALAASVGCWRALRSDANFGRSVLQLSFSVYALALLAKIVLNARVQHYGFALAMPATLLAIVALVGWVPAVLDRSGKSGDFVRAVILALLAVVTAAHLDIMREVYRFKTVPVGEGGDAFIADFRGQLVAHTLKDLPKRLSPEQTMAVLPEGVMLNYLARRKASTRYYNFMPPELAMFSEDTIAEAFQAAPPDYVVYVHKDTSEYGVPFFGRDYGRTLYTWIEQHYESVGTIGQPPLRPGTVFGIQLMARRRR